MTEAEGIAPLLHWQPASLAYRLVMKVQRLAVSAQ
jgi:hypothetical protein